jgi:hypothetical protein
LTPEKTAEMRLSAGKMCRIGMKNALGSAARRLPEVFISTKKPDILSGFSG